MDRLLSTSKKSAKDRIADAEYRLVDGQTVAITSMADILDGVLTHAIDMDELGGFPAPCVSPTQCVWTATFDDGPLGLRHRQELFAATTGRVTPGSEACHDASPFPATAGMHDATTGWSDRAPSRAQPRTGCTVSKTRRAHASNPRPAVSRLALGLVLA
jgi:hypothetical protein